MENNPNGLLLNGFRFKNSENQPWGKNMHPQDTKCAIFQAK